MAVKLSRWLKQRFPIEKTYQENLTHYYVPKNFNVWYLLGSLALFIFGLQIFTGIFLTMYYTPTAKEAFASIEFIMRDVNYGWLIRYLHSTGASFFFIVIYLHMFRSLLYGSHKRPRELVWLLGMLLYLVLLAEAFMGYLLPWGQMSYWGAQVITSLFSAIPGIGPKLTLWMRGDYTVADATLHRFFALHIIAMPLIMIFLVRLHIKALHYVGANNPTGIDLAMPMVNGKNNQIIPFHPYYTIKDLGGLAVFLLIFVVIVFFAPEFGGYFLEPTNFMPADPLQTPSHIAPIWYMTPFYAMLRAIPDKLLGVMIMAAAIAILFVVPWLDRSPVRSIRYRGWMSKVALFIFSLSFLGLGYLGLVDVTPLRTVFARIFTTGYFAFFLLMPFYTALEKTKLLPERL
ncbi:MAG: petB [Gammaproteobacteria bacterium]|jgi:ubiquinol-cytochrome c reductase cytochrome b subunit|nr:petB [Gammaproteobacteria bacterium]